MTAFPYFALHYFNHWLSFHSGRTLGEKEFQTSIELLKKGVKVKGYLYLGSTNSTS
jgi:hypothetical protein